MSNLPQPHPEPRLSSAEDDLVAVFLGAWTVAGVYADGWAHANRSGLETFFSPWHVVLYSGFAALAAWVGWLAWRDRATDRPLRLAIPAGYGLGILGIAIFALGGLGDMIWHLAFGVEAGLDALVSPTHLLLLTGGALLLSSPWRAVLARNSGPRWSHGRAPRGRRFPGPYGVAGSLLRELHHSFRLPGSPTALDHDPGRRTRPHGSGTSCISWPGRLPAPFSSSCRSSCCTAPRTLRAWSWWLLPWWPCPRPP